MDNLGTFDGWAQPSIVRSVNITRAHWHAKQLIVCIMRFWQTTVGNLMTQNISTLSYGWALPVNCCSRKGLYIGLECHIWVSGEYGCDPGWDCASEPLQIAEECNSWCDTRREIYWCLQIDLSGNSTNQFHGWCENPCRSWAKWILLCDKFMATSAYMII